MEKTKKARVKKVLGFACLALLVFLVGCNLIRYPLKAPLSRITGMKAEECELTITHYGRSASVTDANIKEALVEALGGDLKRNFAGDWLGRSSGPEWALALSDGKKEVMIGIDTGVNSDAPRVLFEHYYYTLENTSSQELLRLLGSILP